MSTTLARRFERYSTALAMISEGIAELEPAEAASLLRSALALVETEPPAPALRAAAPKSVAGDVKAGTTSRALAYVKEHGSATVGEVATELGVSVGSASASLRKLYSDRLITRAKRGTYEAK